MDECSSFDRSLFLQSRVTDTQSKQCILIIFFRASIFWFAGLHFSYVPCVFVKKVLKLRGQTILLSCFRKWCRCRISYFVTTLLIFLEASARILEVLDIDGWSSQFIMMKDTIHYLASGNNAMVPKGYIYQLTSVCIFSSNHSSWAI